MQAIRVTFIPPTNDHGTRYRAKCAAGSVTIPQVSEYDPSRNAAIAVGVLVRKLGWPESGWTVGTLADGLYVAVHASGEAVPVGHTHPVIGPMIRQRRDRARGPQDVRVVGDDGEDFAFARNVPNDSEALDAAYDAAVSAYPDARSVYLVSAAPLT